MFDLTRLKNSVLDAEFAPNCDVYHDFLSVVNRLIRTSPYSRPGVIERINDAAGTEATVTVAKLQKWLAPSADQQMPMHYLPALCWALGSIEPANALLKPLLHEATDQRTQILQEFASTSVEAERYQRRANDLKETLFELTTPTRED